MVKLMHLSMSVPTTPLTGRGGGLKGISNSFSLMPLPWGTSVVSQASPFTREEGSGQLRIMSLCCRVSSGQAVQGVSSNSMLFVVSRDAVLAGLFGAHHTEYAL